MKTLIKKAVRKLGTYLFKAPLPEPAKLIAIENPYEIKTPNPAAKSVVDDYWGGYTIKSTPFPSAQESLDWLQWRSDHFHLSFDFKGLWTDHQGKTMVDYGCGPGHDLMGFLVYSNPAKIYGIDISRKALSVAGHNVALHGIPPHKLELIQTADLSDRIPLADASVDYVHCCGVLHHTSSPETILREFHRILKPSGKGLLMVYNKDSVFYNLYVAYARMQEPQFKGMSVDDVFRCSTDGPQCPISRCHQYPEFCALCRSTGFDAEFVGGFVASNELDLWTMHAANALRDHRLAEPHKSFLRELEWDSKGLPMYRGKYAGIGGTYRIVKK